MYCANLEDNRVIVQCNIVNLRRMRFVSAIYDTGARYTCFRASTLSVALQEESCLGNETKMLGGFIGSEFSKFYKFEVEKFAFGTIDIGKQAVWITFDEAVTSNVVGYDIIKQVNRLSFAGEGKEYFFGDRSELLEYVAGFKRQEFLT